MRPALGCITGTVCLSLKTSHNQQVLVILLAPLSEEACSQWAGTNSVPCCETLAEHVAAAGIKPSRHIVICLTSGLRCQAHRDTDTVCNPECSIRLHHTCDFILLQPSSCSDLENAATQRQLLQKLTTVEFNWVRVAFYFTYPLFSRSIIGSIPHNILELAGI